MVNWSLAWNRKPILTVTVHGLPIGQGAVTSLGTGRPSVHKNGKILKPWRAEVRAAFEQAAADAGLTLPIDEHVALDLAFTMPKSKSAPKRRRTFADRRPDGDHLVRAIGDALQPSVLTDDARIVDQHWIKTFPLEHPDALPVPGVLARLYLVEDPELAPVDHLVAVAADDGIPW